MGYLGRLALIIGAAALFAGCGGSQPPIGAAGVRIPSSDLGRVVRQKAHATSTGDLLYGVWGTGVTNMIYVLTYPGGTVVNSGSLPNEPFGSCVDASGNVFVTSQGKNGNAVYQFAPGSVTPTETLNDPGRAIDCSVDVTTGNLAVANFYDYSAPGGPGPDIAVYAPGEQTPILYSDNQFFKYMLSCTYDNDGNLFIGGLDSIFRLGELAKGASDITGLSLDATISGDSTSLRWDGKHVALTVVQRKHSPTMIYQISVYGSTAEVVGTTKLISHSYTKRINSAYGWISAGNVVEPTKGGIGLWRYPSGGKEKKNLKSAGGGFSSLTVGVAPSR